MFASVFIIDVLLLISLSHLIPFVSSQHFCFTSRYLSCPVMPCPGAGRVLPRLTRLVQYASGALCHKVSPLLPPCDPAYLTVSPSGGQPDGVECAPGPDLVMATRREVARASRWCDAVQLQHACHTDQKLIRLILLHKHSSLLLDWTRRVGHMSNLKGGIKPLVCYNDV